MQEPPLSTPLSQLLVAFTIELDNEVEARMAEAAPGRFRISVVMWSNFPVTSGTWRRSAR
jgi:hypothetical protein